jgi:hypothetical protein
VFIGAASVMITALTIAYVRGHDQLCTEPAFGARCSPPQDPWVMPCEVLAVVAGLVCAGAVLTRITNWVVRG